MKIATVLASVLASTGALSLLAPAAAAQPVTSPAEARAQEANALGVSFLDPDNAVDKDQVRAAIGAELAMNIVDEASFAPAHGRIEIAVEAGVLRIAYHPAAGTVIERTLALPAAAADRLDLIAFVATNLVRDQATEAIASLPDLPPPPVGAAPQERASPVRHMPFSIGLVPPLSLDRIRGDRVDVGVGIFGLVGKAHSSSLFSVSGLLDVKSAQMQGAQVAGLLATAGFVDGAQLGGLGALSRGSVDGVQIGGIATAARGDVEGVQIGGIANAATGDVDGAQLAGIANVARGVDGFQIGGIANLSRQVDGAQIAGIANVAGDVNGVQIGVVNVARRMKGVQLGIVNYSEDGEDAYPIGLINYSRNGRIAVDAQVDSSRISSLAFRHGSNRMHNVWGIGWSPDHDHVLVSAGLGTHGTLQNLTFDVEAMQWLTNVWNADTSSISQLRASVAVPVASNIEIFGGVAANVHVSDQMDEVENFHPVRAQTWDVNGTQVTMWPSAFAGVRLRAR